MNEDRAARYHRLRRRAVMLAAAWSVLLLAGLLATGGSHAIRDAASSLARALAVPSFLVAPAIVAIWVVAVALVHEAGALPFAFYGTFLLERRYGLARQSAGEWLCDHLKALGVGLGLAVPAAVFTYLMLAMAPSAWWVAVWAGSVAVGAVLTWAAPVILLPLFFHCVPLADEGLRERLLALAARLGAPAIGIFEWRLSDRTSRANAVLAGVGSTRRILLSDTLVTDYPEDEIEVILAHELAHHVRHDVWRSLVFDAVVAGAALMAADAALRRVGAIVGVQGIADVAGAPLLLLVVMAVSFVMLPLANALSRGHERRADRVALELTNNSEGFMRAMRRLGTRNLAEEAPSWMVRLFFYTHPPIEERLAFARAWQAARLTR